GHKETRRHTKGLFGPGRSAGFQPAQKKTGQSAGLVGLVIEWWTIKQAFRKVLCESQSYDTHRISAKLFLYFMTEIGHFFSVLLIFP
ncbi:MAG: hypothetical protein PHQ41_08220, partial [Candidatus Cloacimonetes bacterium]|nr:hypothetical protein [Candidatus Cloacimonadota bacterium]